MNTDHLTDQGTSVKIKDKFNGVTIYEADVGTMRECVESVVRDGVRLQNINLCDANLRGAGLRGASLRGANLRGADLRGASLRGAGLRGADLRGANLRGANLRGANLFGADLRGADLCGANLYDADLGDADLGGAGLRGAGLRGANLYDANMRGVNLRDADLCGAYMTYGWVLDGRWYHVVNIGSDSGTLELYSCGEQGWVVRRGCFQGSLSEFLMAVADRHGDNEHGRQYRAVISALTGEAA